MLTQIHDDDLKLLRIFRSVADCGGFTAAQAELNMSQSTISVHVARLEKRMGMKLCSRGNTGFRLTEEGKFILDSADNLFTAVDRFRSVSNEYFSEIRGDITIGAPDIIATHEKNIIIDTIRTFSERCPRAKINLVISNAYDLEEGVTKDKIDVSFGFFCHKLDALVYKKVFDEKLILYCGKRHYLYDRPDNGRKEISLKEIRDIPYASRGPYEEKNFPDRVFRLQENAFSTSIEGLALLILSGKFIGYLPDHYAAHWVARGEMRPLLETTLCRTSTCHMILKKDSERSRVLDKFLGVLRDLEDSASYLDRVVA